MKKYFFTLIIICFLYSCNEDFLDVVPGNQLSDATFWKTKEDADMALVGCYKNWDAWSTYLWLDAASDNLFAQHYDFYEIAGSTWRSTSGVGWEFWFDGDMGDWTNGGSWFSYTKIRKYNNFLTNIEKADMDQTTKEIYKAEVRFLRAFDYFTKTQLWGDMPLVTELIPSNSILDRTPVAEVQKFIIDEMEAISQILPIQNNIQSGGHITAGAALALKARLELYTGKYDLAMIDAKKVIDMTCYELNPDYQGMFQPGNATTCKEAILTINYIDNYVNNTFILQMLLPASYGGYSGLGATKSLVDAYETTLGKTIDDPASGYDPEHPFENRDVRMDMTFLHPGMVWNDKIYNSLDRYLSDGTLNLDFHADVNACRTGMNILKYIKGIPISQVTSTYGTNIVVIRLAEMYLTYAEAAVETSQNLDIGLALLNQLRERGNLPPATELTQDLVRRERRVELALEGLRRWDIKRWDIGSTALNGPTYGSREGSVNMTTGEVTWADTYIKVADKTFNPAYKYLLPIPQKEMDISGMTQNDGY